MSARKPRDGRFATFVDDEGNPPCSPPDDCLVCRMFTRQRTGETRADWLSRVTGLPQHRIHQEAS